MKEFNALNVTCRILTIIGWLAVVAGIGLIVIAIKTDDEIPVTLAGAILGSGLSAVLASGAVQVLIAIYWNARGIRG
jgi:hypothetical protein